MPDFDPLNASELDDLERRLTGVALSPTPHERERLLYACGQAAGRAQMRRRAQWATVAAALLGCTSAVLCGALVLREQSPPVAQLDSRPRPVPLRMAAPTSMEEVARRDTSNFAGDQSRPLTVATGFEELMLAEVPQDKSGASRDQSSQPAVEPVLTAAGPPPVDL